MKNILVIKHGALGDLIQTTGILKSIREHNHSHKITLLTDPKFFFFTKELPYFDDIIYDERPSFFRLDKWIKIIIKLVFNKFDIVYDLQNSDRTSIYFFFISIFRKIIWSGNRRGGKYKYSPSNFEDVPVLQRLVDQLQMINLKVDVMPDLSWMNQNIENYLPKKKFIIFIPGCSPKLKHKRWPPESFGELALNLEKKKYTIIIVGTDQERNEIEVIKKYSSLILDYSNHSLLFLASLSRYASGVVANDTGPTFVAAGVNCPTTWILSHHTNPHLVKPQCENLKIIKKPQIQDISVDEVENNLALRN